MKETQATARFLLGTYLADSTEPMVERRRFYRSENAAWAAAVSIPLKDRLDICKWRAKKGFGVQWVVYDMVENPVIYVR